MFLMRSMQSMNQSIIWIRQKPIKHTIQYSTTMHTQTHRKYTNQRKLNNLRQKIMRSSYLMALPKLEERCIAFTQRCDECTVHDWRSSNLQHALKTSVTTTIHWLALQSTEHVTYLTVISVNTLHATEQQYTHDEWLSNIKNSQLA